MIRRVRFDKAVLAGIAGAVAWEIVLRLLIWAGLPLFDLVQLLGTTPTGNISAWMWWPIGLAVHAAVGAIWAVFYAYFFWSTVPWRPAMQGLVFAVGPAVLAGLVMVPHLGLMNPRALQGHIPQPGVFAWRLGWGGPVGLLVGHAVYGLAMGALYRRPVGYATHHAYRFWKTSRPRGLPDGSTSAAPPGRFMFATGIECSYPTIDGGRWRMDELQMCGHYRNWRRDLELVGEVGLSYLRYGPPLHLMHLGRGRYDWSFLDEVAPVMQALGIVPIMDLCHFGVPDWLGNFQNPEFPEAFAEYAEAFAQRYPWVKLYTPVNEMYVTARMSALDGVWNEQLRSERGFVTAARHLAKASALAIQAILRHRPDATFINSESTEFYQPCCPDERIRRIADFENQRRFIAADLLYAHPLRPDVREHLFRNGMAADEYAWFMSLDLARSCVLGLDYYEWNEKVIDTEGRVESLGELFGWYAITNDYYERYHLPLMHTETNRMDAQDAPAWLWRQWHNVRLVRERGIPVLGFTWYSLHDQVDWNIGLSRPEGNVNPVGLFDLNRDPRPVAQAYRHLLHMYRDEPLLPAGLQERVPAITRQEVSR